MAALYPKLCYKGTHYSSYMYLQVSHIKGEIQFSPFVMLCLGSIGMACVISEPCHKWTILQRNYRKMTI